MNIPTTRRDAVIEDYHGTPVADPYRWLEDVASAETQAWGEAQNALTQAYLEEIPIRECVRQRLTTWFDYPKYSVPRRREERFYFSKNDGLQNQSVLYMQHTLHDEAAVVLDPNTFSEDGTIALINPFFTKDGTLLAYSTSHSGSDWQEIRIRDVDRGTDYDEAIQWVKFTSIAWRDDNRGFYYNRFPEPGSVPEEDSTCYNKVYWHTLGTPQAEDKLTLERPDAKELGFAASILLWAEHGGVYAVANLRGGNEYGEDWHQAGMLEKKQNVFDDFIAATEWLIANNYTNTSRLAIHGGSNGGLLVAACMIQRPDLFGAVVCEVPVIDMLRYHRFTVGRYWIPEYGDAEHNPDHFRFLSAYSPLHNIKEGVAYPPTLIMTADTDDRVVPAHAKKFTAALQAAHAGNNPILLRLEMKAGHGMGKPTSKIIEARSDMLAFLCKVFGMA